MAEQLVNEFTVNRPIDEAWAVITDVEGRAVPARRPARGDRGRRLSGVVKVKLGSITPSFKGQATFIDRDDRGTAPCSRPRAATPAGRATPPPRSPPRRRASPTSTRCVVTTDLHITGRVAQFDAGSSATSRRS